jgi:hypothetical protein
LHPTNVVAHDKNDVWLLRATVYGFLESRRPMLSRENAQDVRFLRLSR